MYKCQWRLVRHLSDKCLNAVEISKLESYNNFHYSLLLHFNNNTDSTVCTENKICSTMKQLNFV